MARAAENTWNDKLLWVPIVQKNDYSLLRRFKSCLVWHLRNPTVRNYIIPGFQPPIFTLSKNEVKKISSLTRNPSNQLLRWFQASFSSTKPHRKASPLPFKCLFRYIHVEATLLVHWHVPCTLVASKEPQWHGLWRTEKLFWRWQNWCARGDMNRTIS